MPPKNRRPVQDWSWVRNEACSRAEITPAHRRRAAGYGADGGGPTCRYWLEAYDAGGEAELAKTKEGCGGKRCAEWPWCYNHLGGQGLVHEHHKSTVLDNALGEATAVRRGPAGLRNVGAICYANAFLQVWYNNVAFRNGVYACASLSPPTSPLYHLASIFAALQCGVRQVVDPEPLIDALMLNKGEQQDAAEFSKLFMSLIDAQFGRQQGPLATFVKDQFEGRLAYQTRCATCGYASRSPSAFLELEISLKDKSTLAEQLAQLFAAERLDGNNKYSCPQCQSLQPATRAMHLEALPPVLHLSLLRFVYDPASGSRKKSKASIAYPRELALLGRTYDLRGVVTHHGTSAFSGHFTCEVFSEAEGQWYVCNDEQVDTPDERPKKKLKLDPDVPSEQVSKDAYMLVYQLRKALTPVVDPPAPILDAIKADNTVIENEAEERRARRQDLSVQYDRLRDVKMPILRILPGDDCIVPREALAKWMQATTDADLGCAFNFQPVLCEHGNIDPGRASDTMVISQTAHDAINKLASVPQLDVCPTCVETMFDDRLAKDEHSTVISTFDELNMTGDNSRWCISKSWLKNWRRGSLPTGMGPDHELYTVLCEHSQPWSRNVETITDDALAHLRSLYGEFAVFDTDADPCAICSGAVSKAKEDGRERDEAVRRERPIFKNHRNQGHVFGLRNYLLPAEFAEQWESWLAKDSEEERPVLRMRRCEHGLLDVDVGVDRGTYLSEQGWMALCQLHGHDPQDSVSVEYAPTPAPGKRFPVVQPSVATCEPCRRRRLLDFGTTNIHVVVGRDKAPVVVLNGKRTTRSLSTKEATVRVSKTTTVKTIKIELYNIFSLSPICQRLYYGDRVLESDETVESIGLLSDDVVHLEELEEVGDMVDVKVDGRAEGFGGTALLGRIACSACTFDNAAGVACCEMCDTPM